jgi:hypothetical protein
MDAALSKPKKVNSGRNAPISRAPNRPQLCPAPTPSEFVSTAGLFLTCSSMTMTAMMRPANSSSTIAFAIRVRTFTPKTFIRVVSTYMMTPRISEFFAKSASKMPGTWLPKNSKPDEIDVSTCWMAEPSDAWPANSAVMYSQPAAQPQPGVAICLAHW